MNKHNGMRPQDIVILLKMITLGDKKCSIDEMADRLGISISEISKAMDRNVVAGLVSSDKARINKLALRDFLIHGLKYVFPPLPGSSTRGVATAHSAPPVNQHITESSENYVWKYYKGTKRGNSIVPLYDKIPKIVENQPELYEFLTIIDTLRIGKKREIEIAINELDKRLNTHGGEY
jgi:DNA-binding Lrp family transcriptional regulator